MQEIHIIKNKGKAKYLCTYKKAKFCYKWSSYEILNSKLFQTLETEDFVKNEN